MNGRDMRNHSRPWIVALVVLAAAAVVVSLLILDPGSGGGGIEVVESGIGDEDDASGEDLGASLLTDGGESGDAATLPDDLEKLAIVPDGILLSGLVTDKATGEPVGEFHIKVTAIHEGGEQSKVFDEAFRTEDGRFTCMLAKEGEHYVWAYSPRHEREVVKVEVPPDRGSADIHIELDPGAAVSGRVVEDATGLPVEGALVGVVAQTRTDWIFEGNADCTPHAYSDSEGRFRIRGLIKGRPLAYVTAMHPGFAAGNAKTTIKRGNPVEIRLKKGFQVFGRVLDDRGRPAAGVRVSIWDSRTMMDRYTATDANGDYRSAPAPVRSVVVTAHEFVEGGTCVFTRESRTARIVDRDVEVNFGPSADHITWRGRVIDYDGTGLAGAKLIVSIVKTLDGNTAVSGRQSDTTSADGRFELRKLFQGVWKIKVALPGQHRQVTLAEVTLDHTGITEKEIRLADHTGAIRGRLVHAGGSESSYVDLPGFKVSAWQMSSDTHVDTNLIGDDGSFIVRGLPAGTYSVVLSGHEHYADPVRNVKVVVGRVTDLLPVSLKWCGILELNLIGFSRSDFEGLSVHYEGPINSWSSMPVRKDLLIERKAPGDWILILENEDLGACRKEFTIAEGKNTKVTILRSELATVSDTRVTVTGTLRRANGSPVSGTGMTFSHKFYQSGKPKGRVTTTDEEGRFTVSGLWVGSWTVRIKSEDPVMRIDLHDLVIPADPPDPVVYNPVIPGGEVKGILVDGKTNLPLSAEGLNWRAGLVKTGISQQEVAATAGMGDSRFRLMGIPAGKYNLYAHAEGYEAYSSDLFEIRDGQKLDLGNIRLEPTGIIDIEVVDPSGELIKYFRLYRGDIGTIGYEEYGGHSGNQRRLASGKIRYWLLPTGRVELKVRANSFREMAITVDLAPARPLEVRVVLDPK